MVTRRLCTLLVSSGLVVASITEALASSPAPRPDYGEPNDSRRAAYGPIEAGFNYSSYVGIRGDRDWYFFGTTRAQQASITVANDGEGFDSPCQTVVAVVSDAAGNEIAAKRLTGVSQDVVNVTSTGAARYYVEFSGEGNCDRVYAYTLRVASDAPLESLSAACVKAERSLARHIGRLASYRRHLRRAHAASDRRRIRKKIARERSRVAHLRVAKNKRCQ